MAFSWLHRLFAHPGTQSDDSRYVELVEQAIAGFLLRRPSGEILMVNNAYCRLTGYTRDELLKMKIQQVVSSIDAGVLERTNALKAGESTWTQARMLRKDGSEVYIEASTHRLANGNLQSTVQDITERRRAEKAGAESERRYAELVDQALEGITVRKPSGEFLFVNDMFCRIVGYTRAELLRMNIRDVVHPEDAETIEQVERLRSGDNLRLEKRMRRKDGHVVYVAVSARRLQDGNLQTTIQDISDHKRAEQAREASERRYTDLVEQAADSIWIRDANGEMLYVNEAASRMLGYTREELLRTRSPELLHPSDSRTASQVDRLKPLETLRIERVMRHKDGHPVPVEASVRRLANGDIQVISHDITERKRAEQRLEQHAEEIRLMSQRLLEAQETERRNLAREMHDEVGQALTAARINLQELEQQTSSSPFATRVAQASGVIANLLQQVRQLSLSLHPSVLDDLGLAAALRWCVRERVGRSGLKVTLQVPEDLPRFAEVTEITLFRVFQEALSNVMKHAEARDMTVTIALEGGRLTLMIRDDGKGFSPEAARKHALSGASLGLIGMQERVRLAGGEIMIESAPGKGTEMQVSVPATMR